MQLYSKVCNLSEKMGPPSSLSMINLYIFPSSSGYPFNMIEINVRLGLIYLKLKEIFALPFHTFYLKEFYSCSSVPVLLGFIVE